MFGASMPVPSKIAPLTLPRMAAMDNPQSLEEIFESQLANLATTREPGTVIAYRSTVNNFLRYLRANYPEILSLAALRRAPHILGWLRSLCERQPPLNNETRRYHILRLRCLLNNLALSD